MEEITAAERAERLRAMLERTTASYEREREQAATREAEARSELRTQLGAVEALANERERDLLDIIADCHDMLVAALDLGDANDLHRTVIARAAAALELAGSRR